MDNYFGGVTTLWLLFLKFYCILISIYMYIFYCQNGFFLIFNVTKVQHVIVFLTSSKPIGIIGTKKWMKF